MGRKLEDELLSFQCHDVKLPTLGECGEATVAPSARQRRCCQDPPPGDRLDYYEVVWTITLLALLFIDCVMKAS
jgi:hypothetical protein